MIKMLRVLFKKDPPMGKWIDFGEYQVRWRRDWKELVEIVDYDRIRDRIKLRRISKEEVIARKVRDITL